MVAMLLSGSIVECENERTIWEFGTTVRLQGDS